ncbi:ATP-binding protein [Streptomyces physcomitrii]|uniref:ATP-binding protein n=1 Tax=Streptomyces physcomitrii TaxID=2724184 RepID=A0ABX1GWK6_9ACTN|nr:ATP-binding protein [Streptomyces physcomitrii]NKI40476.1 ATP-binding protein [Streptomyces physcomitrii]
MKQSAVKTLGVAALGAAFAAVGAGAASAAPATPDALGTVTGALDSAEAPKTLPAADGVNKVLGVPEQVADGVDSAAPVEQITGGLESTTAMAARAQEAQRAGQGQQGRQDQQRESGSLLPTGDSSPVGGLLGGLPLGGASSPVGGLLGGGLPLGG